MRSGFSCTLPSLALDWSVEREREREMNDYVHVHLHVYIVHYKLTHQNHDQHPIIHTYKYSTYSHCFYILNKLFIRCFHSDSYNTSQYSQLGSLPHNQKQPLFFHILANLRERTRGTFIMNARLIKAVIA